MCLFASYIEIFPSYVYICEIKKKIKSYEWCLFCKWTLSALNKEQWTCESLKVA